MPGNSTTFTYNWYDRALLAPYTSLAELGIYNATLTAFTVLSDIPGGIARILYPAYAEIQGVKGRAGLEEAIRVVVVWSVQYVWYSRLLLPAYALLGFFLYLAGLRVLRAVHSSDIQLAKQFLGKRYEQPINLLSKILGSAT